MPVRLDYSVIIATYNYGRFLAEAVESALGQTVPAREVIVVDDGSEDETAEVIRTFGRHVRAVHQPNRGQAAAWNRAFALAGGQWISFLDADDSWLPHRIERCLDAAADDVGVVMHDLAVVGPVIAHASWARWKGGRVLDGDIGQHTVARGLPWVFTPTSGFLARRRVLETIFPLNAERWRTCADAPVLHRSALRTTFRYLDEPLGRYRIHGANAYHQQGWYDGDDNPRIILENLWLLQRLAYEVNLDLRRAGRTETVALWNHTYYARMIGWVSGRRSWWSVVSLLARQTRDPADGRNRLRSHVGRTLELHRYQRSRDLAVGSVLRSMAASDFPALDLKRIWTPDLTEVATTPDAPRSGDPLPATSPIQRWPSPAAAPRLRDG